MPLEFVKSHKGVDQLLHDGYIFTREKLYNGKTLWKCVEFHNFKCKGRVHTFNDEVVKSIGEHNHVKRFASIEVRKIMSEVKEIAASTIDSPQQILASIARNVDVAIIPQLPEIAHMKRTIRRSRQLANNVPANPASLEDLLLPERFKKTHKGENFLFHDTGSEENRIIIFATERSISLLSKSPHWYADGTFKTSPNLFAEIYTIHGVQNFNVMPALYAFLPNKTEETYTRLFSTIKEKMPSLNPISILTDFEVAAQNSIKNVFPEAEIRGCFFHFMQAIWRQIQGNRELKDLYESSVDNSVCIRQLASLAFVPISDVLSSFSMLLDTDFYRSNEQILIPLLDYFECNWLGRTIGSSNIRRSARFPIPMWNCYTWTLDGLPRTNNAVEGWHRSFSSLLSAEHPTIWKCIEGFKDDYGINEMRLEQLLAGSQTPTKKVYKNSASRILTLAQRYGERNIIDYLRGIAHNFDFQV